MTRNSIRLNPVSFRSKSTQTAVEIAGSFSYFGISANLITYLTGPLGQSNASAAASVNAWSGTASLMPLLGAFLADAYLGRYGSIVIACSLYVLVGTVPAALAAAPSSPSPFPLLRHHHQQGSSSGAIDL